MIHSICGMQNEGKTLYTVRLAYEDWKKGRKIITNMDLSFPHYRVNKDFVFWLGEKQPSFRNISFVFDELWLWLDSRTVFENRIATYFFLQSSKSDANIYLTAQDNGQNEIRIRNNLHRYTECRRFLLLNKNFFRVICEERDLKKYSPYLYIECKTFNKDLRMANPIYKLKSLEMLKAINYFNYFDTREKKVII